MHTTQRTLLPVAVWFVPALMLVAALGDLPYSLYVVLRWVVCGLALLLAFHEYELRGTASGWVVILVILAILFNPLFPVGLSRAQWAPIDAGAALFLDSTTSYAGGWQRRCRTRRRHRLRSPAPSRPNRGSQAKGRRRAAAVLKRSCTAGSRT